MCVWAVSGASWRNHEPMLEGLHVIVGRVTPLLPLTSGLDASQYFLWRQLWPIMMFAHHEIRSAFQVADCLLSMPEGELPLNC
jgi:hypothetical protein